MKEIIKKYFGETLSIIGSFIVTYNFFAFSFSRGRYISSKDPVAYYYTDDTLIMLSIGAVILVTGILIIKNKTK